MSSNQPDTVEQASLVQRGREAFQARAWDDAFGFLTAAGREAELDPEDLERLVWSSMLTNRDTAAADALDRTHAA